MSRYDIAAYGTSDKENTTMEKKLREEIVKEVTKAVEQAMMKAEERWLTADELCKQFQMFNKDFVDKYGDCLPRKRVHVTFLDGETRGTRWAYPQHQIAMNIADGLYDDMKLLRQKVRQGRDKITEQ